MTEMAVEGERVPQRPATPSINVHTSLRGAPSSNLNAI